MNAALAALYIVLIVLLIQVFASTKGEDTILIPITMLSLLVLSVAVMGFLFISGPFRIYFDGKKEEAVMFFLKTLGTFALFVALFVGILMYVLG